MLESRARDGRRGKADARLESVRSSARKRDSLGFIAEMMRITRKDGKGKAGKDGNGRRGIRRDAMQLMF